MTNPEDTAKGARAMYESSVLLPELFDEPVWEKLDDPDRNDLCKAFSAGLAAMPDHSAELLKRVTRIVASWQVNEIGREYALCMIRDLLLNEQTHGGDANARAQKGGEHG